MSARTWRVCVFLLLLATTFITAYALLALLGFFGGASGWGPFPLGGSLLLFATCGWILLWPRLGSWLGAVFLLCIACWPVITVISNLVFRNPVDFFLLALLVPISVGLWFTSREALGFTRHISPKPGLLYVSFGILMIVMLPVLAFANFYAGHRPAEVREFPVGFRGEAIIVWNEPG